MDAKEYIPALRYGAQIGGDNIETDTLEATDIAAGAVGASELATDAVETAKIKALAVTAAKLAADSVETAKIKDANVTTVKILDANVTLAKLAAGVTPSHIVKYAGTASGETTATRAYTITGVLATDVATAVIRASTTAVSIQKATLTDNTLTVLFSADPGASTTVDYVIVRAAA